ncbi:cytochrome P450 [Lizonia empirigonia]|nr:cytochrome P450 [Lizonia empirigonia]
MSFDPIVALVTPRLVGSNAHTKHIIQHAQKDQGSIIKKSHHIINPLLMPQRILGASKTQLDYFSGVIAKINDGSEIDLHLADWKPVSKDLQNSLSLWVTRTLTDINERARLDVAMSLGFNVNASGTTFWVVNNIFSRPELLSQIREEIRMNALVDHGVLSADCLRQACPRLNSVYRETMRLYVPSISARLVHEDTILADTWLLRKDAIVQLAGSVLHHDPEIWGPDVDSFNPDRFLYSMHGSKSLPDGTIPEGKAHFVHPAAFRSFGGGASLCPGRHFAHMEILGLAAVLIMGFDIEPIGGTKWNPPADTKRIPVAVMKPMAPLNVRMKVRKEFEGVTWEMRV